MGLDERSEALEEGTSVLHHGRDIYLTWVKYLPIMQTNKEGFSSERLRSEEGLR